MTRWIEEGDRFLTTNKFQQAADAYAQAIKQEPNKPPFHFKLGKALLQQGQVDAAERCFQQALTLNAQSHLGLYGMAQVTAHRAQWQDAIQRYQHLLTLTPSFETSVYRDLAYAYGQLGNGQLTQGQVTQVPPKTDPLETDRTERSAVAANVRNPAQLNEWPYAPSDFPKPPATLPNGQAWPKISIVTPSYNQGQFIEETILSVINQHYPNVEYILVDGGSTDETLSVAQKYKDYFSYFVSEPDKGQSSAINKGFQQATGDIFTWINSDDRFAPGALYAVALAFYASGSDMIAGGCELWKDDKHQETHLTSCATGLLKLSEILDIEGCWLTGRFFYQPEVMFTRDLWQRAGGFVDETLYYSMDYELWARFASVNATIEVIGRSVAQYRMHEAQKTSTTEKYKPELLATCKRLQESHGYDHRLGERRLSERRLSETSFSIKSATESAIESGLESTIESTLNAVVERVQRPLRIVFFNDVGNHGGAGIAHHRIAQAFHAGGHQVTSIAATLDWALTPANGSPEDLDQLIASYQPDLVVVGNVHNTQYAVKTLKAISAQFLTLFVMHDQWLITGRCAYTGDCTRYLQGCGQACPTWAQYPSADVNEISDLFAEKRALMAHPNFFVAADSPWLARWAQQSARQGSLREGNSPSVENIFYGLDTDIFNPGDRAALRRRLGLPEDRFIIISGSQSLKDERKGSQVLLEALNLIDRDDVTLVCFGHGAFSLDTLETHFVGFIENPEVLAWYYAAADLFVGPSLEEAFGQTFIEAAACGTPAVGFAVGGVSQAIADNISGKLAKQVTAQSLAETILQLIENPTELDRLKASAPIHIRSMFSLQRSYYTLVQCLEKSGILDRLNIRATAKFKRIGEMPEPTSIETGAAAELKQPLIAGENFKSLLISGFGHAEHPRPDLNLMGGSRWLLWPMGKFAIDMPVQKAGQLTLYFRNLAEAQAIVLKQNDETVSEISAATCRFEQSNAISVPVSLQQGLNFFSVHPAAFHKPRNGDQKLGLLIEKILFSPLAQFAAPEVTPSDFAAAQLVTRS